MTRATFVLVPLVALACAALGASLPWGPAIALTLALASVATWVLWVRQRNRVDRVAAGIGTWLSQERHQPVELEGGEHWRHLATAVNTLGSELDRITRDLRLARRWRRRMLEALVFPAMLFARDGRLVASNAASRRLLDLVEEDDLTLTQALASGALVGAVRETLDSHEQVQLDAELGDRQVRAATSLLDDEVLMVLIDLTEQRRVEDMRRNFVVNASHELKTPVAGIQALADALEVSLEQDGQQAQHVARRLREEAQGLGTLVHDLLNLRRLEEDERVEPTPVDLVRTIRAEADLLRQAARDADVALHLDLVDQAVVAGIQENLRLIVKNLLTNAIQYNVAGGDVHVRLRRSDEGYELTVRDTGIGIAQQDLARVFERFYRVDVARSRASGGTGLGLSIVRHAVERHGGRIDVDSLLGEGSTFRVVLPVQRG